MNEWILLESRRPERNQHVIVVLDYGDHRDMETMHWGPRADAFAKMNGITHWMPAPSFPEVKS